MLVEEKHVYKSVNFRIKWYFQEFLSSLTNGILKTKHLITEFWIWSASDELLGPWRCHDNAVKGPRWCEMRRQGRVWGRSENNGSLMATMQQWPNAGGRKLNEAPHPPFPHLWRRSNTQPLKTECEIKISLYLPSPKSVLLPLFPDKILPSSYPNFKHWMV